MSSIFSNLCNQIVLSSIPSSPHDIPRKPLSYLLNEMTRYVVRAKSEIDDKIIIYDLQILLLNDVERVRAAAIRALRYSIHRLIIFEKFIEYRFDYLICRSLAIDLRNARERLEAYKLIRRFVQLYPQNLPQSFIYILLSIISSSSSIQIHSDQMINCCLELLCEISLFNPHILRKCHAINIMIEFILDLNQYEVIESILYSLLYAIDRFTINDNTEPTIIDSIDTNGPTWILIDEIMHERHQFIGNMFNKLVAIFPLCEKANMKTTDRRGMTPAAYENLIIKESDRIKRLKACTLALTTILHSWIGFTAFCQSSNSSVRLLVNCLMVQSDPMKMIILDLFYDVLNLDSPIICDNYETALKSTYPIYNLTTVEEGFTYIASEGAAKLPRLSSTRPNLLDSHLALILLTLIDAGFLEAITELASNDNTILSIRATLLLANFIWLCNEHLPEEQSFLLLPLLMDIAIADDDSIKRSFAKEAMLNINAFFEFKQRTRHSYSFQLAQLIYHSQHLNEYYILTQIQSQTLRKKSSSTSFDDPLAAERIDNAIRDTFTLQKKHFRLWNWDLILALLKDFPKIVNQIQGDLYERFLDKLFDFFKPEQTDGFNTLLLTDSLSNVTCRSLLALSDLLIYPNKFISNHIKYIASNIVRTLLSTINNALKKTIIAVKDGTGQLLISDQSLLKQNNVYYYLFFGRLSRTSIGTEALNENEIFLRLTEMLKMDDDFVISSIVALSSLNFYFDNPCRNFLIQTLKSSCFALRLYSTSLLRVLLRCNPVAFGEWGLILLCSQLHDTNQSIFLEAISILDEALEDKRLVQILYEQWRIFLSVKDKHPYLEHIYHLASSRLCSIPFHQIPNNQKHLSKIRQELHYWDMSFNRQYVLFMETRLFGAFSGGAILTDEFFERRKSSTNGPVKRKRIPVHVSSHIYRQLCLHDEGFELLKSESRLEQYANEIKQHPTNCVTIAETYAIKEALWALAHTASTENGYTWFIEKDLLADFLRFAEECQNLSVRGTAFYGLSLIAQTPDGAMTLKGYGWETYRVRAHSIPTSIANTDTYQCAERRMSKLSTLSSPTKSTSPTSSEPVVKQDGNGMKQFRFSQYIEELPELKPTRSLTMPSSILLNSDELPEIQHSIADDDIESATPTNDIALMSFPEGLLAVPIRRSSSISKELTNLTVHRDSGIISTVSGSYPDIESNRSPSFSPFSYNSQTSTAAVQSATNSLPLERFRPRSKSAHQSNALRQMKQLQKIPEVIQALRAPTDVRSGSSESTTHDELYRSRLLRCNFLLKPDAIGYEYARRIQEISHATYSHMTNNNYHFNPYKIAAAGSKDELLSLFSTYQSKFYKKFYEQHSINEQSIERFTAEDGKYSFEQRDLDDADEDNNTIYRGLAVPVDIRQVIEMSDGYNLNYETWSDLVRSRSRANTNADLTRTRSATNTSNGSGEFAPVLSPPPTTATQEQAIPPPVPPPPPPPPLPMPTGNICMMCINGTTHEDMNLVNQTDFCDIKALASRLIVGIHVDEVEKKLLNWKESRPQIFDNICLYSEICYILSLSRVRIVAQRFLHDLFSDCHFAKLRKNYRQTDILREENDEEQQQQQQPVTTSYF